MPAPKKQVIRYISFGYVNDDDDKPPMKKKTTKISDYLPKVHYKILWFIIIKDIKGLTRADHFFLFGGGQSALPGDTSITTIYTFDDKLRI